MPPTLNPLSWSDFQFNILLTALAILPLFPAGLFLFYHFTIIKIELFREEERE